MALLRYRMSRGRQASGNPLPDAVRQDTRKHTKHCLRPEPEAVEAYLAAPTAAAWRRFAGRYRAALAARFDADRTPFDALAELATHGDVAIGCSCPTKANPDVRHCHTWLALEFMQRQYRNLDVRFPG